MSNIKIVRLLSGEELLGDVTEGVANITIKDVCQVATSYADPQQATAKIGIAPYLPYGKIDKGLVVGYNYVGFMVEPVTELLNEYNKIFGSGIIVPDQNVQPASKFVKG